MQYFFHQHIKGRKSHLASTQEFNKLQDWCKKGWVLLYYRLTVFSTTAVGVALVDLEKPWITLICKLREKNVEGTRSILWKLCDSYSKWVKSETNDRTWLLLSFTTDNLNLFFLFLWHHPISYQHYAFTLAFHFQFHLPFSWMIFIYLLFFF